MLVSLSLLIRKMRRMGRRYTAIRLMHCGNLFVVQSLSMQSPRRVKICERLFFLPGSTVSSKQFFPTSEQLLLFGEES